MTAYLIQLISNLNLSRWKPDPIEIVPFTRLIDNVPKLSGLNVFGEVVRPVDPFLPQLGLTWQMVFTLKDVCTDIEKRVCIITATEESMPKLITGSKILIMNAKWDYRDGYACIYAEDYSKSKWIVDPTIDLAVASDDRDDTW
ncbi:hypothetical protein BX616_007330 [Lobosporangium transversale]|nr:hypothetical protein BX616_007330 [Lobosporangium transversale]